MLIWRQDQCFGSQHSTTLEYLENLLKKDELKQAQTAKIKINASFFNVQTLTNIYKLLVKPNKSFLWQTLACWVEEWHDRCNILRCINYFICINYLFNRNESHFLGDMTNVLKGFIHFQLMSFLKFYKFIIFHLTCLSLEENVMWIHLNMLGPKVHEFYTLVCIIKWYLHCCIYVMDVKICIWISWPFHTAILICEEHIASLGNLPLKL